LNVDMALTLFSWLAARPIASLMTPGWAYRDAKTITSEVGL
jgi:hypothetical protein